MTPRAISLCIEAYAKNKEEEIKLIEYQAWLNGTYTMSAIMSTIGNSGWFKKPAAKPYQYPDNPMMRTGNRVVSEEEKQREVDLFFAQESARRANWKRKHKNRDSSVS